MGIGPSSDIFHLTKQYFKYQFHVPKFLLFFFFFYISKLKKKKDMPIWSQI